jgi:hypothetical protein
VRFEVVHDAVHVAWMSISAAQHSVRERDEIHFGASGRDLCDPAADRSRTSRDAPGFRYALLVSALASHPGAAGSGSPAGAHRGAESKDPAARTCAVGTLP